MIVNFEVCLPQIPPQAIGLGVPLAEDGGDGNDLRW